MKYVMETESILPDELQEKLVKETSHRLLPGTEIELRCGVPGTGCHLFPHDDYLLPTFREAGKHD